MRTGKAMGIGALCAVAGIFASVAGQAADGGILPTRWDAEVSAANALPDYPRPQMIRRDRRGHEEWLNLNGAWDYALTSRDTTAPPDRFPDHILVPYPWESALSGVKKPSIPNNRLWYRKTFSVPASWKGRRVLLHFGAVNWDSTVAVNGKAVGSHRGGYDGFDFDITDDLKAGENELVVSAWNPVNDQEQVLGKQRLQSREIWYTAATGIWQTVWLEPVTPAHIDSLKIVPDLNAKTFQVTALSGGEPTTQVLVTLSSGRKVVARASAGANTPISLVVDQPHLWTPDDPFLYDLHVELKQGRKTIDTVDSYCAMRKISVGKDASGVTRMLLNDKFVFEMGVLDQGYWPDGVYTAPTDDALRYDIETAKRLGLNMIRKHAKVEPERWYYWTDKLGMLVWQDMPQTFGGNLSDDVKQQWLTEWRREIETHRNHPSIIVWTPFNEGWGQHDTEAIVKATREWDPTRLINNASGWNDAHVGDLADTHQYPGPGSTQAEDKRASVNGEFGAVPRHVEGHMWPNIWPGYHGVYFNEWQTTKRYEDLIKAVYDLKDTKGMSAAVYCQMVDTEQEPNGFLTYDRAMVKVNTALTAQINRGIFPQFPPNPNAELTPRSQERAHSWRYTFDQPAANWADTGFDDAGWKQGSAPFGHVIGHINTELTGADIWMRRAFTVAAPLPPHLILEAFHDDDAEVYLNGVAIAHLSAANTDYADIPLGPEAVVALKPGKNVLAVHCHQISNGQIIDVGLARGS